MRGYVHEPYLVSYKIRYVTRDRSTLFHNVGLSFKNFNYANIWYVSYGSLNVRGRLNASPVQVTWPPERRL
jgi:hypothetical protein